MTTTRLQPGDPAPTFDLPDADGTTVSLADYLGRRVIIYFYPAAMTPGCTTQAGDFRDNLTDLDGAGVAVIGISPDPIERLAQFRDEQTLNFPLLSDVNKSVMDAYGVYGEKQLYGKTVIGVIRSTFVIDTAGTIEKAMYNVKATGHVKKLRGELAL